MLRRNRGAFSAPTQRAEGQVGHGVGSTEDQQVHDLAELRTLRAIAANRKLPARARKAAQQQLADRIVPAPVFLSGGTHYDYSGYPVFLHPPLVNRPAPTPLTQVGGPGAAGPTESQVIQAAKNRGARSGMPGEVLRSQEAQDYMRRIDEMPGAHQVHWGNLAQALFEKPFDVATGIPTFVRDPSLANAGWVAASVLPVGKVLKGASTVAKYGQRAFKMVGPEGEAVVKIPRAGSRIGAAVEAAGDVLRPAEMTARKAATEVARTEKNIAHVMGAPAQAARRAGLKLTPAQQVALLIVAEGATPAERVAAHARWKASLLEAAKDAKGARKRSKLLLGGKMHDVASSLVGKAEKYVEADPTDGGMRLRASAPARLKETWRLVQKSADTRDAILRTAYEGVDWAGRLQKPGRFITGAENFTGGKAYVEHAFGYPGLSVLGARKLVTRITGAAPGRALGLAFQDPNVKKALTGALAEQGFRRTDVTNLTAKSAAKALKVSRTRRAREILLPISYTGKQLADEGIDNATIAREWQAIKVDPTVNAGTRFREQFQLLSQGEFSKVELKHLGDDLVEAFRSETFPAAAALDDPNIRWVPRELASRIVLDPVANVSVVGRAGRGVMSAFEAVSDINRLGILYLNPAYIPVNLLGNVALNLIDEGVLAFRDWGKAFTASRKLSPESVAAIDALIGSGLTHSLALKTSVRGAAMPYTELVHTLTDMIPRRAAFFHHAAKEGLRTNAELEATIQAALKGNKGALAKLDAIARKGNDALVDFDRMGTFERDVLTKMIFVYPWIKGATRYTSRFPLEHPLQAAAGAKLGYEANQQREQRGPAPYYTQQIVDVPDLLRESIPRFGGTVGDAVEAWFPYLKDRYVDIAKFTPFLTPIEQLQRAYQLATGKGNLPVAMGAINPTLSAGLSTIMGIDPETGRELKGNLAQRFSQAEEGNVAPLRAYKNLVASPLDEQHKIRPQGPGEKIAEVFLGGGAPSGFNEKVAAERVAEPLSRPDRAAADARKYRTEFVQDWKRAGLGDTIPVEINRAIDNQNAVRVAEAQLAVRLAGSVQAQAHFKQINEDRTYVHSLTSRQKLAVRLNRMRRIGLKDEADQLQAVLDSTPDNLKPFIIEDTKGLLNIAEAFLGYGLIDSVKRDIREIDDAEQLRVATEVTVG